ncbi:LOW QUALITY PROTEIN: XK-related protein 5 [Amazona ochrocephala]
MLGAFPRVCLALLAAESGARLCAIIHYLVCGQLGWFGLTVVCVVPGYAAQLLSILWFRADGCRLAAQGPKLPKPGWTSHHRDPCRYWDVLWIVAKTGGSASAGEVLMQHGDVCVLQLLEALLQTLPHLLMQQYIIVAVDPVGFITGVSSGLCLPARAWASVSYSRFTCLLKPSHLCLPAAAILCLLLWRTGMLGTRVLAVVLFARLYSFWVFAVAGVHWLLMSFWLVAQKTDIAAQPCWRLFNCLVGAVYIFSYNNVQSGPSKHRVAVFYAIMLLENTLLLLLTTRFLQTELRNSLCVTGAVMSGSVIGAAALMVYYSLLHPKSTEICQGFLETACSTAAAGDEEVAGDSSQDGHSLGISGDGTGADPKNGNVLSLLQFRGCLEGITNHHHWLLVKLALKTGDMPTINTAFGDGGMAEVYPGTWMMGKPTSVEPEANLSLPKREISPGDVDCGVSDGKLQAVGSGGGSKPSSSTARTAQEDGAAQEPSFPSAISFPSIFSLHLAEGSSVYYSASAGGITSPSEGTVSATSMTLVQRDIKAQPPPGCLGEGGHGEDLSLEMVTISPILGTCAHKHIQHSSSLGSTGGCGVVGHPKEGLEPVGLWGALMEHHCLWDTHCGHGTVVRSKLRPPRFTPKADPGCPQ